MQARVFTTEDSRDVILFDGICNLCNGFVAFVLGWDEAGVFRFAAMQSPTGRALLLENGHDPEDMSSMVLITADTADGTWTKSRAMARIAARLAFPMPILAALLQCLPVWLSDSVYDWVAANRYFLFGSPQACCLQRSEKRDRFLL